MDRIATAFIRKNDTGEIRKFEADYLVYFDGETIDKDVTCFAWEENNYSCDCNRRLFFARAKGEVEDWESPCSDGLYAAAVVYNGEVVYAEFDVSDKVPFDGRINSR